MLRTFWKRISDLDRLSYAMVVAFGACLLGISLFFQFGYMIGERQIVPNPLIRSEQTAVTADVKLLLLDEPSPVVRGIEIAISLGLIVLGAERLITYKKRRHNGQF